MRSGTNVIVSSLSGISIDGSSSWKPTTKATNAAYGVSTGRQPVRAPQRGGRRSHCTNWVIASTAISTMLSRRTL